MKMKHKLVEFLSTETLQRSGRDYEAIYDDFVKFSGGARVAELFSIPTEMQNADYFFLFDNLEIVLELKQVTKFEKYDTVNDYFSKELSKGKLRKLSVKKGKIQITPESLPKAEWNRFYQRFRPSISNSLNKASRQLKDTEKFIPQPQPRSGRAKGVILMNSGDYNLSTDLLYRITEWKLKKEWKMGNYTSIDFVSCITLDMYRTGQHPLHARHIVRTKENQSAVNAVRYLYDKWVHYAATAFGLDVRYEEKSEDVDASLDLNAPFQGKMKYQRPADDVSKQDE